MHPHMRIYFICISIYISHTHDLLLLSVIYFVHLMKKQTRDILMLIFKWKRTGALIISTYTWCSVYLIFNLFVEWANLVASKLLMNILRILQLLILSDQLLILHCYQQFLREELKYDSGYEKRHKTFHYNDDTQISVKELWEAWLRSEVNDEIHFVSLLLI